MSHVQPSGSNRVRSPHYGVLQELVDGLFPRDAEDDDVIARMVAEATGNASTVRRLDVVMAGETLDLPEELTEVIALLPPGDYTRRRLCDQLNSILGAHAWGQVFGTVS